MSGPDAVATLGSKAATLRALDLWPVVIVVILYGYFFCAALLGLWPLANLDLHHQGLLGESFGTISALFNGLAFAGLIITILIQSRELRLQREQLGLQRTELHAQRGEAQRLADAQEEQTLLNAISAYIAAETYSNRLSSGGPTPLMTEAYQFLAAHLQREMTRQRESPPRAA